MPYKDLEKRKQFMKEYYQKNKEQTKEDRKKSATKWRNENRVKFNENARKFYETNKDKILSNLRIIRKNPIIRKKDNSRLKAWRNIPMDGKCERCDNPARERHHEDYNQPLKVNLLCGLCHANIHGSLKSVS